MQTLIQMRFRLTNPLSALDAMRSIPGRFGDLPGDDFVRDQFSEVNDFLRAIGFHNQFLGEPQSATIRGQEYEMGLGQAPMVPFGAFSSAGAFFQRGGPKLIPGQGQSVGDLLQGGRGRLGPSASPGERLRRQLLSQSRREGERSMRDQGRALRYLPELDPKQNAFREYLISRGPGQERGFESLARNISRLEESAKGAGKLRQGRRQAESDQKLMLIEELEDLMPDKITEDLMRLVPPDTFSRFLGIIDSTASRSRAGQFNPPEEFLDARIRASNLIEEAEDQAAQLGDFERAARLAATRLFYERTPREVMNDRFGTFLKRESFLKKDPAGRRPPQGYKTEGKAWVDDRDRYLKMRFRQRMQEMRKRGLPRHGSD